MADLELSTPRIDDHAFNEASPLYVILAWAVFRDIDFLVVVNGPELIFPS